MKRKTLLMAALMGGCSLQGMAQQITPRDVAGDKEYNRVCREYELKGGDSMELIWTNILIPAIKTGCCH